jgi:predicted acyl esterase
MKSIASLLLLVFSLLALRVVGQETATPTPPTMETILVQIEAVDGLLLFGEISRPNLDGQTPAVLALHQNNSARQSWQPIIPTLLNGGYAVLAVDMRGFGETGGARDFAAGQADVQHWLDWMRVQPYILPDSISIIGASIGANLALIGCAADPSCVAAIALSPGLNYFGVEPQNAVTEGFLNRSVFLVGAQSDPESAEAIRTLFWYSTGNARAQLYPGSAHGTDLFAVDVHLVEYTLDFLQASRNE